MCLTSYMRDVRGTVIDNSWAGQCHEPAEDCPDECQTDAAFMTQTCYNCHVPATCQGQHASSARVDLLLTIMIMKCHLLDDVKPVLDLKKFC